MEKFKIKVNMKKTSTLPKCVALLFIALFISVLSNAQCKAFVKKQIPKLSPYIHNGQLNSSVLLSGDQAELTLTFYSGQTYRVMVGSQETLGDVYFILKDSNKNQVFNSKDQGKSNYWDFTVESTQQLTVEVKVPDVDAPNGIVPSGCVSILVGFRQ
jgi:hypothetical protein